jgi:hypothetical protein
MGQSFNFNAFFQNGRNDTQTERNNDQPGVFWAYRYRRLTINWPNDQIGKNDERGNELFDIDSIPSDQDLVDTKERSK